MCKNDPFKVAPEFAPKSCKVKGLKGSVASVERGGDYVEVDLILIDYAIRAAKFLKADWQAVCPRICPF